jgi:polar amino acid transport system substrate-binding protein
MRGNSIQQRKSLDCRPAQKGPPDYCCGRSSIDNRPGRLRPHPNPIIIVLTGRQREPWAGLPGDTGEAHRLQPPVYKPFEFKDSSNKVVGFDVDLMDLVAKKLGVTLEIFDVDFASQTSGAVFAARKCDAAMGAVTITDKRKEAVAFSDPYFKATQALLVKKDSGINDLSQLRGKKLGVQTDTTGQIYAEDNKAANGYEIVVFDDGPTTLTGVLSGRVAASINDNGTVYDFAKDNPTTTVSKEFNTGEQYGFMVQKDNANAAALLAVINDVLKTSKTDGSYDTIYKKWFGVQPA